MIDAWEFFKCNIKNSGKTVLGHFPKPGEPFENYIHKTVRKGAYYRMETQVAFDKKW